MGVDDDILAEIEQWRDALAKNIALRNPSLTVEELNSIVQRTIDRILFLRICEDRGIEEYETLHKLMEGEQVYGGSARSSALPTTNTTPGSSTSSRNRIGTNPRTRSRSPSRLMTRS